jgi:hypothetical protein
MITLYKKGERSMLEVFAKKVPVTNKDLPGNFKLDSVQKRWFKKQYNVEIFRDREGKNQFCTFLFDKRSKPTKKNKYVTLNCYCWRLVWL